jgi:hypothetical protein
MWMGQGRPTQLGPSERASLSDLFQVKDIRNIRFNKDESAFAQHILDQGHKYGPMEQIMELIEYARKGNIVAIKENYYIYKFKQRKELIEEQNSTKDNNVKT